MPIIESKHSLLNVAGAAALDSTVLVASTFTANSVAVAMGLGLGFVTKTGNYLATVADFLILVDASGGAVTISLPALAASKIGARGLTLCIKKMDASANAVIIDPNGAETADGAATLSIVTQYEARQIIAGTSEWSVI